MRRWTAARGVVGRVARRRGCVVDVRRRREGQRSAARELNDEMPAEMLVCLHAR